jgi:hypothetical protein
VNKEFPEIVEMIIEYMALVATLSRKKPSGGTRGPYHGLTNMEIADYRRANQLSWELAILVDESLYRDMIKAITHPTLETNIATVILALRQEKAPDTSLSINDIAIHAPGIGKS